ncbi:MAG: DNA-binding response OmpR family regulator [Paracoccaceae bacterium]|jgi:DNA-binding response OmpR family regulator
MAKRVLLAEDEPNIVESLTFLMERAGFDISAESDGRLALEMALSNTPDILILDVMLPELDGYEILRQLRADSRTEGLPILMLTAKGQREDREAALECGADLFITKPFSNSEIVAAVKQLVAGRPAPDAGKPALDE